MQQATEKLDNGADLIEVMRAVLPTLSEHNIPKLTADTSDTAMASLGPGVRGKLYFAQSSSLESEYTYTNG